MKILNKNEEKKKQLGGVKDKKHQTNKEKAKLRKKLLKVLNSGDVTSSGPESEVESVNSHTNSDREKKSKSRNNYDKIPAIKEPNEMTAKESSKKIKTLIKNKETLHNECEMVNVISDIITSKPKPLLNKIINLTSYKNPPLKKSKETKIKNNHNMQIEMNGAQETCSLLKFMEKSALARTKKKISQNTNYKRSVMEVFNSGKLKSAIVKTVEFNLDFGKTHNTHNEDVSSNVQDIEMSEAPNNIEAKEDSSDSFVENEILSERIVENEISKPDTLTMPQKEPSKFKIYTFLNCCVLVMRKNINLYFCGKVRVTLIQGCVDILGYKMDSVPQDMYSPPTSSLLYFHSQQHSDKKLDSSKLFRYTLSDTQSKEIVENLEESDSVLILEPLSNIMTKFVTKHNSQFNPFVKEKLDVIDNDDSLKLLQCHFFTENRRGVLKLNLLSSSISNKIINQIHVPCRNITMICGGKSSGKSTFLRYLLNQCVGKSPVLVLDFDPGQPEFTVCGLLSATVVKKPVLGPNFTHLTNPDRSLALGFISISENENRYLSCVQDLYKYCSAHGKYSKMPWIVNTSGFTGPIGLKLIVHIMNIVRPNTVVELMSNIKRNNFDISLESERINEYQNSLDLAVDGKMLDKISHDYHYYNLDPYIYGWSTSKSSLCRNMEPREERILNCLAYFSQIANSSLSILEQVPYVIFMDDIKLAFNHVYVGVQYLYSVINGKTVALCHDDNIEDSRRTIVNVDLFPCYGYGIVRGIDYETRKIYIVTPLCSSRIAFVNTLVYGESLPDCSFTSVGSAPEGTFVPYMLPYADSDHNKHLMKTPKRKFNPFRLLEIKNKSS